MKEKSLSSHQQAAQALREARIHKKPIQRISETYGILGIEYIYHNEEDIPKGYQFYTKSNTANWMFGWNPQYNLEKGLSDYKKYLNA